MNGTRSATGGIGIARREYAFQIRIELREVEPPVRRTGIREKLGYHAPLALYEYDFGGSRLHEVRFEKMVEAEAKVRTPRCIDGARRCPPEDCGGPGGFEELLCVLADPEDDDHASMREWCGGRFDPEAFDAQRVRFQDPAKRWREVFEDDDA